MAVSFASKLKVSSEVFDKLGVFNPILDLDTRLFIDPHLLKHTDVPELFHPPYRLFIKAITHLIIFVRFWHRGS